MSAYASHVDRGDDDESSCTHTERRTERPISLSPPMFTTFTLAEIINNKNQNSAAKNNEEFKQRYESHITNLPHYV